MSLLSAYLQGGIPGLVEEYVYHRWFEDKPIVVKKPTEISIPRVDDGTPIPIIYGRCRVRQPVLAWHQSPEKVAGSVGNGWPTGVDLFRMNMFMVLGYGFEGGTNLIHGMFAGEKAFFLVGTAANESDLQIEISTSQGIDQGPIGGRWFCYGGGATQDVEATTGGITMIASGTDADNIPSYRGMLSVLLFESGVNQWILGSGDTVPAYSFEASSYKSTGMPATGSMAQIGQDSNPMNALYDLLLKLGVPAANIDSTTFGDAAATLYSESHGYSRCIEDRREAGDRIMEIMRQVDGTFFYDETESTFKVKLVRNDYDPATIPHIQKTNGCELVNFASGGWYNVPNKVKLIYENSADGFRDGSATVRNQANAVGQDGVLIEHMIEMRGVTNADLAARLAARELAALSRPMMRCRALVDRSFVRVNPGDVVKVTWSGPDLAGVVFRVAAVDRGTLDNGKIALDLIEDVNYVYRGRVPEPPALTDRGIVTGGLVGALG